MEKEKHKRFSMAKRIKSFRYAFKGLLTVMKFQHNFWIHCVSALLVVLLGFLLKISLAEWLFIVVAIGFVLSAEVFNSAIEELVNLVSPDFNKRAGLIKDMAAGAVLIAAISAAVIGLIIFIPHIIELL